MHVRARILGCGGSYGVPSLYKGWNLCNPDNPRNRRSHASVLIEAMGRNILIDAGPECRLQLLEAGITRIDALMITHMHADHCHGIDDMRGLAKRNRQTIPVYCLADTAGDLVERFSYLFRASKDGLYPPFMTCETVEEGENVIADVPMQIWEQDHVVCTSMGVRVGGLGYSTDLKHMPEHGFAALKGVKTWILSAVQRKPHPTHTELDQALRWIEHVQPECAFLTHMNDTMDYDAVAAETPDHVMPGYDGLEIEVDG